MALSAGRKKGEVMQEEKRERAPVVEGPSFAKTIRVPLGFGPVRLGPGETKRIEQVPQVAFKVTHLKVDRRTAKKFVVVDIKVGQNSQLATAAPIPATAFAYGKRGLPIEVQTAMVAQTVTLVVQNVSDNYAVFTAAMVGVGVVGLPEVDKRAEETTMAKEAEKAKRDAKAAKRSGPKRAGKAKAPPEGHRLQQVVFSEVAAAPAPAPAPEAAAPPAPMGEAEHGIEGHGLVKLEEIFEQPNWNSRQTADDKADKELADSIAASGLLQPLVVKDTGEMAEGSRRYFLVSGFRRFKALRRIGWKEGVPVSFAKGSMDDLRAMNIIENEQRRDLKPWELADACYQLSNGPATWGAGTIAQRLGKSQKHIANMLRVRTKLHPELWEQMKSPEAGEKITLRWWIKLAALPGEEQLRRYEVLVRGVGKVDSAERGVEKTFEGKDDASDEGESETKERPAKPRGGKAKPPTDDAVVRMKDLVSKSKMPREWKRGAQAALGWFLGESDAPIPG